MIFGTTRPIILVVENLGQQCVYGLRICSSGPHLQVTVAAHPHLDVLAFKTCGRYQDVVVFVVLNSQGRTQKFSEGGSKMIFCKFYATVVVEIISL